MWAKVEGYRWWPAHVLDPNDHREEMRDAPKLPDRAKPVLVRFHHTQDIGFMAPSKVLDFAEHVKEKSAGGKKGGGFAQAVAAAKAALGMATEGTNGDHGGDQNPAIDDSNKKTKAPAPTSVDKDNDVGHTKPPSGTKLERTPRVSERDVEAARPRRQAAAAGEEQRREGPKVIPGELGAAAGYLHGAASRAQERLEAGLSDAEDGSDTEDGSDSDASSDGEDAGEKAARALGGFAASGRSTSIGAERGVDDFERSMRWYMGVDDPKEAGVVAGLGVHLSEVGVLVGKAAEDDIAAEEGHHGRMKVALEPKAGMGEQTTAVTDTSNPRRASKREAAAAATEAIVSKPAPPASVAASTAAKQAKDAAAAARDRAKKSRTAANAAVAAANWGVTEDVNRVTDGTPALHSTDGTAADDSGDDSPRKTRACHQCGRGHAPRFECKNHVGGGKSGGGVKSCGVSYCDGCARRHYPQYTRDEMQARCPKCVGTCTCRACLRDPVPSPSFATVMSESRRLELCETLLVTCAPTLRVTAERETNEMAADAECAATRDSHEDAMDASGASGWRLFCDMCGGAVANLHRSCWACEVDLCVECCSDLRTGKGVGDPGWKVAGGVPAATPASALVGAKGHSVGHSVGNNKRGRDAITSPPAAEPTNGVKPVVSLSDAELAALPVKKRLKLMAVMAAAGQSISTEALKVSSTGVKPEAAGAKIEVGVESRVEVGVESRPCAEPLLCVQCTRPMELRSCVERKWLDRVYKSTRYLDAMDSLKAKKSSEDEAACPWCVQLPVGSESLRDCGAGGVVWCPRARDLRDVTSVETNGETDEMESKASGRSATLTDRDALRHFRWHWARGEPVVVRGIEPAGADWSPETLERALRDGAGVSDISGTSGKVSDRMVPVVDACKESTLGVRSLAVAETMTPHDFFKGFQDQRTFGPDAMYRMDGWPSEAAFKRLAPRHRSAVLAGLPFQEYTNPVDGPLNLITHVAKNAGGGDGSYPGDGSGCGPRTRVAYGRVDEVGGVGDAVSQRLRTSSADTVEVLYHASSAYVPGDVSSDDDEEEDEAAAPGAVWHVFARSHEAHLVRYLSENGAVLAHPPDGERRRQNGSKNGSIGTHTDAKNGADRALAARLPLHDGRCFLTSNEIDELGRESGGVVKPWVIYQKPMEAILVPAGCARQTRNLKSCVGVAVDFASPESAGAALRVGEAMRELPGTHAERTREGVHARTTVLHAAHWAVTRLEAGKEDSSA